MTRAVDHQAAEPGFDSFLDIVANLVGILVILIMVIGVRTREAWDASARASIQPTEPVALPDVQTPQATAAQLRSEVDQMAEQGRQTRSQLAQQQTRYDQLRQRLAATQAQIDQRRQRLAAAQRQRDDLYQNRTATQRQLAQMQGQLAQAESVAAEPIVLQHYPTPLARTVFGREEHFRLLAGRLAHVPLNELTEQLKREARLKVWKLKDASRITETLGPVEGFRMKYTLQRREDVVQTGAGIARRTVIELDRFVLVPVRDDLGEPVQDVLRPDSEFRHRLQTLNPKDTTITVWTYPDSYRQFRELKEHLHQLGFLTAARPLPAGLPITGSPSGTKSSAQ